MTIGKELATPDLKIERFWQVLDHLEKFLWKELSLLYMREVPQNHHTQVSLYL